MNKFVFDKADILALSGWLSIKNLGPIFIKLPTFALLILFMLVLSGCFSKKDAEFYHNRGLERFENKKYVGARSDFTDALERSNSFEISYSSQLHLGRSNIKRKNWDKAISAYEIFAKFYLSPENAPEVFQYLGYAHYMKYRGLGKDTSTQEIALDYYKALQTDYPDHEPEEVNSKILELEDRIIGNYYYLSNYYYKNQSYVAAHKRAKTGLDYKDEPSLYTPKLLFVYADSLRLNGDIATAQTAANQLYTFYPDSDEAKRLSKNFDR